MGTPTFLWSAGVGAGLIGLILAIWALVGDRSRGRRRCPRCWYDMSALDGRRCPECGRQAGTERRLFRPRRRWRAAFLSLVLLLIAAGLCFSAEGRRRGWEHATPSTALIVIASFSDDPWALKTLAKRGGSSAANPPQQGRDLWVWQWHLLIHASDSILDSERKSALHAPTLAALASLSEGVTRKDCLAATRSIFDLARDGNPQHVNRVLACLPLRTLNEESLQVTVPLLHDPNRSVRVFASVCIASVSQKSDAALAHLVACLDHEDEIIRAQAAHWLWSPARTGRIGLDVKVRLNMIAHNDPDSHVRDLASEALNRFGPQEIAESSRFQSESP